MGDNHLYVRDFFFQQAGAAAANGNELDCQGLPALVSIIMTFGPGSSAGAVTVEESDVSGYTGTWAPQATITWTAATTKRNVKMSGTFRILRCRISTPISGGTVDVIGDVN